MEKKGFIQEFKEFISRGSVMDLAVGVIIGGAFTTIVNSLVKDVVTPLLGVITGGVDFTQLKIVLVEAVGETPEVAICYGSFIQAIINFLLIAIVVFTMIKSINKMNEVKEKLKKEEEASEDAAEAVEEAPAEPSEEILLLREIRDSLKK